MSNQTCTICCAIRQYMFLVLVSIIAVILCGNMIHVLFTGQSLIPIHWVNKSWEPDSVIQLIGLIVLHIVLGIWALTYSVDQLVNRCNFRF